MAPTHQHTNMVLHHRRADEDMRRHFRRTNSVPSQTSSSGQESSTSTGSSSRSHQTQVTRYTVSRSLPAPSPPSRRDSKPVTLTPQFFPDMATTESPAASIASFVSTADSDHEDVHNETDEGIDFELPRYAVGSRKPTAIPATPSDFSELFPSHRKLDIRHDDATADGNLNLVLNTRVSMLDGRETAMTLFHLRMYDLRDREFSLRRYCRDSGREVCNVARKTAKTLPSNRPGLQRSLSSALNSIRPRSSEKVPASTKLKRNDSGYGSSKERIETPDTGRDVANQKTESRSSTTPIKLEFSNYAQVEVKPSGSKASRHYDFDYWGAQYSWKRVAQKHSKFPSFHLRKAGCPATLAFVVPIALSESENLSELHKGGWVPPCSIWIEDEGIVQAQKDLSDVIIASGLVALVDSSIYAHFHSSGKLRLSWSNAARPQRALSDMFKRRSSSRQSTSVDGTRPPTRER